MRFLETLVPVFQDDFRRHVRRRRLEAFVVERRAYLLRCTAEVVERPQKLDVVVPHRAHGRERSLGIARMALGDRIELEANAVQTCASRYDAPDDRRTGEGSCE